MKHTVEIGKLAFYENYSILASSSSEDKKLFVILTINEKTYRPFVRFEVFSHNKMVCSTDMLELAVEKYNRI